MRQFLVDHHGRAFGGRHEVKNNIDGVQRCSPRAPRLQRDCSSCKELRQPNSVPVKKSSAAKVTPLGVYKQPQSQTSGDMKSLLRMCRREQAGDDRRLAVRDSVNDSKHTGQP